MMLKATQLSKHFMQADNRISVLEGVSFSLDKGQTLSIQGQSGSGKSTLLALLAGLDFPTSGSVELSGKDLSSMNESELTRFRAAHIGIIFQQFHLLSTLTALENISLPLEILKDSHAIEKAKKALEKVGLANRSSHFPSKLSGGECQRVAIARALVLEPDVLLADEPSGNLDTETGDQVMQLLFDLVESNAMTMVLVTHNDHLAQRCQRQLKLSGGVLS